MNIGIFGVLGVAFIILKILGQITWPWVWVTAPLWGPIVIALSFFLVTGSVLLLAALFAGNKGY